MSPSGICHAVCGRSSGGPERRGPQGPEGAQGASGPAGAPGQTGPPGPAPSCPAGTILHELACIETAQRPQDTWIAARSTCRSQGRRLPSLSELASFEQRGDPFVPTTGSEWVDEWNVDNSDPRATTLRLSDGVSGGDDADAPGGYNFRCMARALLG